VHIAALLSATVLRLTSKLWPGYRPGLAQLGFTLSPKVANDPLIGCIYVYVYLFVYMYICAYSYPPIRHLTQAYVEAMAGLQETVSKVGKYAYVYKYIYMSMYTDGYYTKSTHAHMQKCMHVYV